MSKDIIGLSHLVFETQKSAAWDTLLVDVLGLRRGRTLDDGTTLYRMDDRAMRIAVRTGPAEDLVAVGFEARSPEAMWDVAMRARDEGAFVEEGLAKDAAARCAAHLVRFDEPGGLDVEIVAGSIDAEEAFDDGRTHAGFVTGDQGLGHVALRADDVAASRRFFERVLGFRLSDRIQCTLTTGYEVDLCFLRVNRRHHTLALGTGMPKHLHHFMVQTATVDDLGATYDRCFDRGVRVTQTLGRHPNDKMLSFYAKTPSGFEVECGYGGREVEDDEVSTPTYDRISLWGHRPPQTMLNLHREGVAR